MSNDDESKSNPSPPDLARVADELAQVKVAMRHAANTMLAVYRAEQRIEKTVGEHAKTSERIETKLTTLGERIAVALSKLSDVEDSIDDVHDDITGQHKLPPPETKETRQESIELGPAKVPVSVLERMGRALPWIVLGVILTVAALICALWMSGARLQVDESHHAQHATATP